MVDSDVQKIYLFFFFLVPEGRVLKSPSMTIITMCLFNSVQCPFITTKCRSVLAKALCLEVCIRQGLEITQHLSSKFNAKNF